MKNVVSDWDVCPIIINNNRVEDMWKSDKDVKDLLIKKFKSLRKEKYLTVYLMLKGSQKLIAIKMNHM